MHDTKKEMFYCSCYGEGMLVTKFDGEEEIYFSYWKQGIHPRKLTWGTRLRLIWTVLFRGEIYEDEVILDKKESKRLVTFLKRII